MSSSPSLSSVAVAIHTVYNHQSSTYTERMFKGPYDPVFGSAEPHQPRYHRRSYKTYTSSYPDEITPHSSFEDVRNLALAPHTGPRITETRGWGTTSENLW
ncbi:hypothetical protein E8E11_000778 [Didymella keratinophila]|nr:hypothetical protein E8E11_000778 [Didymella keratinophila]